MKQERVVVDRKLIEKYTLRGPRYTSYPTAPEWIEEVGEKEFFEHIKQTNAGNGTQPLSLYYHLPFCVERCFYCACNVVVTPVQSVLEKYVDWLKREMDLVVPHISATRKVNQIHLGGGTPTHLKPATMDRLLRYVDERFAYEKNAERSVEVDPRVTTEEHLNVLRDHGFSRISTGVQDFSLPTQKAINRMQSGKETYDFIQQSRECGFTSVNIDLVYGLPFQTVDTFKDTIKVLRDISPDRIALYNYAHLPSRIPFQRRIDDATLPSAEERFDIFQVAIEKFVDYGYVYIGLDHFAKPDNELAIAQKEGSLQRNFMGFTTKAGTDLYSFGLSAISSLPSLYTQNVKSLKQYELTVEQDRLPIERGIVLSRDDRIRRWVIMELMCNLKVSADVFETTWQENFHEYFKEELPLLQPFIIDGLVDANIAQGVQMTPLGQVMVRPVAMVFDKYLSESRKKGKDSPLFSRTL